MINKLTINHSSEEEHLESDNNFNFNMDVTEERRNSNEGEEISDMNNGLEESKFKFDIQGKMFREIKR